ncbi:hypothetical protein [Variovorax sp. W2I14]|uniref:hypothetical protein n=1 Tax=Variovorax sp. W2I14 TaxID=3042290 RepID=UPI003D1A06C5
MGMAKQQWMEQQEDEHAERRAEWIRDQLGDDDADENHPEWRQLQDDYDNNSYLYGAHDDYDDDWDVKGKSRIQLFQESMDAVRDIVATTVSRKSRSPLLVMLHAHVVTAVEAYLSSTFIDKTLSSAAHLRKLVETDPEFAERKFSMQEIFAKRESLAKDIGTYLRTLIFHDLRKIKPMYKSVLEIDFGDISWLFKAILIRHDCVHRAGYDKDGQPAALAEHTITELVDNSWALVSSVEQQIARLPIDPQSSNNPLHRYSKF